MARKIAVEIVGDSSSLERAFKKSAASAGKFNGQVNKVSRGRRVFGGLAKGAGLLTGALGIGGLATAARAAFQEMGDAQKAAAQTEAVLKSTGGAANVSADHVDKLATNLLNLSGVDDEAIKSGENMLLTFRNIRNETGKGNDVFDQATKAALDMSVAMGTDMKTSALQLGKALNDPEKGLTRLQRVGVEFTAGQEKQIKAMVAAGNTMGAQKVILQELNKEFGGSAKAAGDTLPGQLNKLKETALNLGGAIAQTLTPEITRIAKAITDWLSDTENQKTILDTLKAAAAALGTGLKVLGGAFRFLSKLVGGNKNAVIALIAAYAGFKALQFAGRVKALAETFGLLTRRQKAARTAAQATTVASGNLRGSLNRTGTVAKDTSGRLGGLRGALSRARGASGNLRGAFANLRGSLVGKAGVAGAVVLAGYGLSKLIRMIPGWDAAMRSFGETLYSVAEALNLVNRGAAEFKPPANQATANQIRNRARELEAGGLTPKQAASRLQRQYVNIDPHDIAVFAGVVGKRPSVQISGGVHVHRAIDYRLLENELRRRSRLRAARR